MDLKTFLSETLVQIVAGVSDAAGQIAQLGTNAQVNPHVTSTSYETGPARAVEFVAITVSDESQNAGSSKADCSLGILSFVGVKAAEIGENSGSTQRNEAVSRVKFSVQLSQPSNVTRVNPTIPKVCTSRSY